jgi:hypothetical protein
LKSRADYEDSVKALRYLCDVLIAQGQTAESVARRVVMARNHLKSQFRVGLPIDILAAIETRNIDLYGDPLGPDANAQLLRYGDWPSVIAAACRPKKL